MEARAEKQALRRSMVARVMALDPAERRRQEALLRDRAPSLPGLDGAATVLLYAPAFPEEIDTRPLLLAALATGKRLVLPRVDRRAQRLRLYRIDDPDRDLAPGTLGIPEPWPDRPELAPAEVDWVLVPGLAFDARGYRLGRGAGHYDRLLPTLRPDAPRWALALTLQLVAALPTEPHDQPLDGLLTPDQCVVFPRREKIKAGS
jgi:5-formyltetrahydrofolate cyclo-ligase